MKTNYSFLHLDDIAQTSESIDQSFKTSTIIYNLYPVLVTVHLALQTWSW